MGFNLVLIYSCAYLHVVLHHLLAAADRIDHIGTHQFPRCLALECRNGIVKADIEWIPQWLILVLWRWLILATFLRRSLCPWVMHFGNCHLRLLVRCGWLMKGSRRCLIIAAAAAAAQKRIQPLKSLILLYFLAQDVVVVVVVLTATATASAPARCSITACCMQTSLLINSGRIVRWESRRRRRQQKSAAAAACIVNQSNCTMRWAQGAQLSHYRAAIDWCEAWRGFFDYLSLFLVVLLLLANLAGLRSSTSSSLSLSLCMAILFVFIILFF